MKNKILNYMLWFESITKNILLGIILLQTLCSSCGSTRKVMELTEAVCQSKFVHNNFCHPVNQA